MAYPEQCTNRDQPDGPPCNRTLRRMELRKTPGGLPVWSPTREFLYHDIKHWVAGLFGRAGLEYYLDLEHIDLSNADEVWDIMESDEIRNFLGHDQRPFIERPGNEGRIFFGLNEDGLNPFGNKTAGKKISTGAIYLVCLNLPLSIRYNIENMCLVGIIPPPHEPSLH